MDELANLKLHRQEAALRQVIMRSTRLYQRCASLGSGPDWYGPASSAYDAGLDVLRRELGAAHQRLVEALHDTHSAVVALSAEQRGARHPSAGH